MIRTTPAVAWRNLRTAGLGAISLVLYILLFANERTVLDLSQEPGWGFLVPVAIAFAFSFIHGAFTGGFWDMLGLKAQTRKEPKRWSK